MNGFDKLILTNICKFLSTQDILVMMCLNKEIRRKMFTTNGVIFKKLKIDNTNCHFMRFQIKGYVCIILPKVISFFKKYHKLTTGVTTIDFSNVLFSPGARLFPDLLSLFPNLRNITLINCGHESHCYLDRTNWDIKITNRSRLKMLCLRNIGEVYFSKIFNVCDKKSLETLILDDCKVMIDDSIITHICDNFKNIKHLDLSWCSKITTNGLHEIATKLENLKTLNIYGCSKIRENDFNLLELNLDEFEYKWCTVLKNKRRRMR